MSDDDHKTRNQLMIELRTSIDRAARLMASINGANGHARDADKDRRLHALERRLSAVEDDSRELAENLVASERRTGRLMGLYVATYQLHATLDPDEVQATIAEIAIDLLGAERFVLLLENPDSPGYEVALAEGINPSRHPQFAKDQYVGGDSMIDATLSDGVLRLGPEPGSSALATVPLTVQDRIVGALVVLKLFDHKAGLKSEDRDILDLLAAHAASALFVARLYASTERKLKTLQGLVTLVTHQ